jgi:putative DNA primase/helicase
MGRVISHLTKNYVFKTMADTEDVYYWWDSHYKHNGEVFIKGNVEDMLSDRATTHIKNEVIGHIQGRTYISRSQFNSNPTLLPLENGVLNLETGEFFNPDPKFLFTYCLPVKYDPDAKCPKFTQIVNEILEGDKETIKVIQEEFGYCLYQDMPARKSFWWYGSGANGKTTLANILVGILGQENVSSVDLHTLEEHRFAVGELYGKLANIIGEPNPKRMAKSNMFKAVTGRDPITADVKFKKAIQFKNVAKMFTYANEYPDVRDQTEAFWDRVIVTGFPHRFVDDNDDKDIAESIIDDTTEMSGVLNWALDGLKRLQDNKWEFSTSKTAEEEKQAFMNRSNPVNAFIMSRCEFDERGFESTTDLYDAYIHYCEDSEIDVCNIKVFGRHLSNVERIYSDRPTICGAKIRGWRGLRIREDIDSIDKKKLGGLSDF